MIRNAINSRIIKVVIFTKTTFIILTDWALDAFFKGVVNNFLAPQFNFHVGMKIGKITEQMRLATFEYIDGTIAEIESDGTMYIEFTSKTRYYHKTGEIITTGENSDTFGIDELIRISDGIYEIKPYY